MKKYICPVCGYDNLDEEPYEDDRIPSHNVCDCCGCKFGCDDNENYRRKWIEYGGKWFIPELKPKDWDMKIQLQNLNIIL